MAKDNRKFSEEKKVFVLSLTGYGKGEPKFYKKEGPIGYFESPGDVMVYFDMYIHIGRGTTKIVIPKEYLEYSGTAHGTINDASGEMELAIHETITVFTSKSHDEDHKWGTLELNIEVSENVKKGMTFPATVGPVSGVGAGALEGVMVEGVDQIWGRVDCAEATDWGFAVKYARVGYIIGWPPEVRSWPPK